MSIFLVSVIAMSLAITGTWALLSRREHVGTGILTALASVILAAQAGHGLYILALQYPPEAWQVNWLSLGAGLWALICVWGEKWTPSP